MGGKMENKKYFFPGVTSSNSLNMLKMRKWQELKKRRSRNIRSMNTVQISSGYRKGNKVNVWDKDYL